MLAHLEMGVSLISPKHGASVGQSEKKNLKTLKMPSPTQQIFIEGLLYAGLFPRLWAWSGEQSRQIPCQQGAYVLLGR